MTQTRESFNTQDKLSSVLQSVRKPRIGEHQGIQDDTEAVSMKTDIFLSMLQYQQLVPIATTFAGNDTVRLKAIFDITTVNGNLLEKTNALKTLLKQWGFVHRPPSDLVPTGKDKSEVQIPFKLNKPMTTPGVRFMSNWRK
jgi:hypothetical protein